MIYLRHKLFDTLGGWLRFVPFRSKRIAKMLEVVGTLLVEGDERVGERLVGVGVLDNGIP